VGRLGKRLRVLGIPGQNEWQEMELTPGVQRSESRLVRIMLNGAVVKFVPLVKQKTGKVGVAWGCTVVLFRPRIAKGKNGTAIVAGNKTDLQTPLQAPLIWEIYSRRGWRKGQWISHWTM
jgi:hypothetical protein